MHHGVYKETFHRFNEERVPMALNPPLKPPSIPGAGAFSLLKITVVAMGIIMVTWHAEPIDGRA